MLIVPSDAEPPDVHLSVHLHGIRMDFAARPAAAAEFLRDWRRHHHPDTATIVPGSAAGLPRLPNEILYTEP
ncbi:hypothetical protein [Nocardia cyriacigeorgica]|uniref:hypothetical protein n=1 Tax=Nocardia cyriacigeorgica TaxID=135487 RepID=UPI0013CF72DD|nr:hypothetical protein [Nocardia cyriacigeorgica]MBF6439746.1 hypothetical protein [Nocardia cyriacigeorgica]NEW28058.1 hypothetical protein [Nocardia cyriacigeorgica]